MPGAQPLSSLHHQFCSPCPNCSPTPKTPCTPWPLLLLWGFLTSTARCPQPSPSSAQHSRLGGVTGTCARGPQLLQGLLFGDGFTQMTVTCHTLQRVRVDQWFTVSTELCISHQPILGHFLYLKKKLSNLSCPLPHSLHLPEPQPLATIVSCPSLGHFPHGVTRVAFCI